MSPRQRISDDPLDGAGPWQFETDADLAAGEAWLLDFREMEYNGTKGHFKRFLPLDQAQVTNLSSTEPLNVEYNGVFEQYVTPNAVESFDQAGVTTVAVTNAGTNPISAGNIIVEVVADPYDADERAREQARKGPIGQVVEKFTGLDFGGTL